MPCVRTWPLDVASKRIHMFLYFWWWWTWAVRHICVTSVHWMQSKYKMVCWPMKLEMLPNRNCWLLEIYSSVGIQPLMKSLKFRERKFLLYVKTCHLNGSYLRYKCSGDSWYCNSCSEMCSTFQTISFMFTLIYPIVSDLSDRGW